jgi:hypothetical protein
VVERFQANPAEVLRFALENLKRWQQRGVVCDDFGIWETILTDRPDRLPEVLCGSTEEAIRLRQSSPFAGLVPEDVRRQILASVS